MFTLTYSEFNMWLASQRSFQLNVHATTRCGLVKICFWREGLQWPAKTVDATCCLVPLLCFLMLSTPDFGDIQGPFELREAQLTWMVLVNLEKDPWEINQGQNKNSIQWRVHDIRRVLCLERPKTFYSRQRWKIEAVCFVQLRQANLENPITKPFGGAF